MLAFLVVQFPFMFGAAATATVGGGDNDMNNLRAAVQ
jgi:hypothetical protein